MGLVRHSDVAAPRAVLRTRIAASYLGSGYKAFMSSPNQPYFADNHWGIRRSR